MAYQVLDLRPDPAMLNPQFDGYKLRLVDEQRGAVWSHPLANLSFVEPQQISSNALLAYEEVYSRIHYNHLFVGPRNNTFIYIDSERRVCLAEIQREDDAPRITNIFDIPTRPSTYALPGYYGAYAISETMILVFDGAASVYVLQRADTEGSDSVDEQWVASGMFEIGMGSVAAGPIADNERQTMYYILGAQLTKVEKNVVIQIQVCYRLNKETGDVSKDSAKPNQPHSSLVQQRLPPVFCIEALQVAIPQFSAELSGGVDYSANGSGILGLNVTTVHTLHSHAIPVYCEFISNNQYVLGVRGGIVLDDTELVDQASDKAIPPNMNSNPYYWTQTATDLTVCIELPVAVEANQIFCEQTRSSLSLQFTNSAECENYTYNRKQYCNYIVAGESVWTLENGRLLTLYLQKEHEGMRWTSVFADDDGVLETMDPNEFAAIRERLEKYTSNDLEVETPSAPLMQPYIDQDSGGDPEQLDAEDPVVFSVRSWSTGQADASSVAGAPDWLCPAFPQAPQHQPAHMQQPPPVCLKFDVDGVVFGFEASEGSLPMHANVSARHTGTFSALSYIQAGKREKRFAFIASDMTVCVLAETQRRVYIYHQVKHANASSAAQNLVDLGDSGGDAELVGMQLVGETLVVLRKHSLCFIDLSLC
ncbi:hypothetical protein H4S00_000423 [Coemansia sp. D1744]|nr:hypothetical protein H4S00_000423 [Coemansia sp. D1744]